jgi:hypothetical protein
MTLALVAEPEKDPAWDGTEFFDLPDDEEDDDDQCANTAITGKDGESTRKSSLKTRKMTVSQARGGKQPPKLRKRMTTYGLEKNEIRNLALQSESHTACGCQQAHRCSGKTAVGTAHYENARQGNPNAPSLPMDGDCSDHLWRKLNT